MKEHLGEEFRIQAQHVPTWLLPPQPSPVIYSSIMSFPQEEKREEGRKERRECDQEARGNTRREE